MQKPRIVLKVGTSNLCNGEVIDKAQFSALANIIHELRSRYDVLLVSSGAIASGYTQIKLDKNILQNRQALASVGQHLLMESYIKAFSAHKITTAQILLAGHNFKSQKHTAFAKSTIDTLLANQILPIINENDPVCINEIIFGDNDRLSAHVAYHFGARLLVILSDIDGYFDKDPHRHDDAKLIKVVNSIKKDALKQAHSPHEKFSTGGIVTKLMAADFLLKKQRMMFLSHGRKLEVLRDFLLSFNHSSGTLFCKAKITDSSPLKALLC